MEVIKYHSNQPVRNSANGHKRLLCSFSPFHLFLFILFFVFCATISDLFGDFNSEDILWITMLSIILTIGQITLFYRGKVLPISEQIKHKIQMNKVSSIQEDTFSDEGITQNVYGQIYNYHYSDISCIYFFSDVIIVRKKMEFILYYARDSFINATEEEWVQFMKSKNSKLKVRRFKFDYIWYF